MDKLKLILPNEEYLEQISEFKKEYLKYNSLMAGCSCLARVDDLREFLTNTRLDLKKETVKEGRVQATLFLCVRESDNLIVGMIQVRHYFNEYLKKYGGHIGYSIRPLERKKGYAKEMLRLVLPFCHEIGLDKVLITCVQDNVASEKTILANNGIYESTIFCAEENCYLKRYWIETK